MEQTDVKFGKQLAVAALQLEEICELSGSGDKEDVFTAYEQLMELIKRLEKAKDKIINYLLELDKGLDFIKQWTVEQKRLIQSFWETCLQIKKQVDETAAREAEEKVKTEIGVQQQINKEQRKYRLQEQQEMEEIARRQQEQEEKWYLRKLDFGKQLRESKDVGAGKEKTETSPGQSVKLQKYTITPFTGEYKDWLCFWNQFTEEVDGSSSQKLASSIICLSW